METIRVRAVGGASVARVRADGGGVVRDAQVTAAAEGESVPRHAHYLRALKRGELALVVGEAD